MANAPPPSIVVYHIYQGGVEGFATKIIECECLCSTINKQNFRMAESVQERLKLKRAILDIWSTREKLSLASLVLHSGDQNWSCVSRNIRLFAEPNRPPDWFSPRNCAQQYASLLENVETPKRKKRIAGSSERTEVETPVESIVRKLKADRIEELKKKMEEIKIEYQAVKNASNAVINGEADDKLSDMLQDIEDEKKKKELEKEAHIKWLKEREERKIELERAWKPGSRLMNIRRASSMSEPSSEADSPLSEPLNVDVLEEYSVAKPTPTSPLLTSLLKSPSAVGPVQSSQTSSILHSAITSPHRGSSPTIASLLSSSPGLPGSFSMPPSNVSSNLKNFVSNAITNSFNEEHKIASQSPSQGAPTLSMLLELPPSLPGKPLPMLKPQPSAPPPYSEHLGPPPPYSQATEYLQKQRAEQLAAQTQSNALRVKVENSAVTAPDTNANVTMPSSNNQSQGVTAAAGEECEGDDSTTNEDPSKLSPTTKEKDSKRLLHNTPDHDYVETSVKGKETDSSGVKSESKVAKKLEMDVFEFDEVKEGCDNVNLTIKDSKMSYLKSKTEDVPTQSEVEKTEDREESEIVKDCNTSSNQDGSNVSSPAGEKDSKKLLHNTPDHDYEESSGKGKDQEGFGVQSESKAPEKVEVDVFEFDEVKERYDQVNLTIKESKMSYLKTKTEDIAEQSEEEKPEDTDESETVKDYDASSGAVDIKSEKTDLSTTEDEKSNDAAPKVYTKRRTGTSFSDSVPNSPAPFTEEEKEYKAWKKVAMLVYTRLAGHKFASLFLKPITDEQAPGYSSIVRRPMDLSSIKRNIELGNIRTTAEFQRDVMLMFTNALMYNERDHHVFSMAKEMQADSKEHFQMLLQVTDENTPSRRETRTQQNADVKIKPVEKVSKVGRPSLQSLQAEGRLYGDDKHHLGPTESRGRGRIPGKNPCGRPRLSDRPPATPGRKRAFSGTGDAPKKRLKTDE